MKKKKITKRKVKKALKTGAFMAPSLVGVALFFVLPFILVIYFSFIDNPINLEPVGFDNYIKLANNEAFKLAVNNTVVFSAIAIPIAVVGGLLLAFLLDSGIPLRSQLRSSFLTPLMVPVASIVLIFQVLFNYNGSVNNVIAFFGGPRIDWLKSEYGLVVIIIMFLWKNLGYNMILFLSALGSVPTDVIEGAQLDGANRMQIFFNIKLRYLSPMIVFTTLLSTVNSFKIFREIYMLTGEYPFENLYMLQHYMNNTFASADYQKMSTAAIYMSLVMIVITAILMLVERWFGRDLEEE